MKRRISAVLLIFLIFFSTGYPVYSAGTDEGYGEDETSLGQFVDSFENLDNVSVRYQVERNATLEAMELNFTENDFFNISNFAETDPANRYSQTDEVSTWAGIRRGDADSRLVGDMGANYFDDSFSLYFELNVTDAEAGDASWRTYALGFGILNHATDYNDNRQIRIFLNQRQVDPANDAIYEMFLNIRTTAGAVDSDTSIAVSVGTNYFMNLTRHNTGDSVRLTIRTGSHIGPIHDTLDVTVGTFGGEFLRYIYAPAMKSNANDPNDESSGTVSRISEVLGGFYAANGSFTTVDYLSNPLANGSALTALFNTSIPANTQILVEFSVDNSTWVFNDWEPLFGGFEAVDLRNLNYSSGYWTRFNLSTTDPLVTPRVYQNRVITTIGEVGAGVPGRNVTGEWIEYRASSINATVGIHAGGDLNSTFEIDGNTWNHTEVVGVPGSLISINFTGVDPDAECVWVTIWYLYDGNLNHDFDIEMWNFSSSAWVDDGHLVDGVVFDWANSTIYALRIPNDFLSGGEVRIQLNHESPGNINHELFIDYIRLIAKIPSDVEADVFQFFWIVIAIALMIVGIVLARMWPDEGDP